MINYCNNVIRKSAKGYAPKPDEGSLSRVPNHGPQSTQEDEEPNKLFGQIAVEMGFIDAAVVDISFRGAEV
jgi:hypothetical protein